MTTGDALLQTIELFPDDDTPKLVYADWLQENNCSDLAFLYRRSAEPVFDPRLKNARVGLSLSEFLSDRNWQRIFKVIEPKPANRYGEEVDLSSPAMNDVLRILALANGRRGVRRTHSWDGTIPFDDLETFDQIFSSVVGAREWIGIFLLNDGRFLLSLGETRNQWNGVCDTHELAANLDDIIECALTVEQLSRLGIE